MNLELADFQKIYATNKYNSKYLFLSPFSEILYSSSWVWPQEYISHKKSFNKKAVQNKDNLKQKIKQWFGNLDFKQKLNILNIRNNLFIEGFSHFLPIYQSSNIYNIKHKKIVKNYEVSEVDSFVQEKFRYIMKNLEIAFLKQPLLHFSKNAQKFVTNELIKWMEIISHNKIFQYANKSKQSDFLESNILWFSENSFHKLQNFLANQLQKCIVKAYFNRDKIQTHYLSDIKQFCQIERESYKNKNIEQQYLNFSLLTASQLSKEEIITKIKQMRQIEERFLRQKDKIFEKLIDEQISQDNQDIKKKKRRPRKKNKKTDTDEKASNQVSPNKKAKQIKSKDYLIEQQSSQQNKDEKVNVAFNDQISQISKIDDSEYHQTDVTFQKYFESDDKIIADNPIEQIVQNKLNQDIICQSSEIQQNQSGKNQRKNIEIKNQFIDQYQRCKIPQNNQMTLLQRSNDLIVNQLQNLQSFGENQNRGKGFHQNMKSNLQSKNKKKSKKDKIIQNFGSNMVKNIRNSAFTEFIDSISIQSNNLYNYKLIAYQFLAFFISSFLPATNITLFGSNAVGLSLASSDIDIMISNTRWMNINQVRQVLYHIGNQIAKMGWVVDYKLILNAKVPVLKLFIDPKIDYFGLSPLKYASQTNLQQSILIKADLIVNIQGDQNIGCQSTLLMKQWLTDHPQLQRIILFFKYVLWYYGLNENYKGGICSYCLFLMVINCLFKKFEKEQNKEDKIFEYLKDEDEGSYIIQILKYYSQIFDSKNDQVSINMNIKNSQLFNKKVIKQQISPNKRNLNLKVVDPINGQYIESSFSKFQQIQQLFSMILVESLKADQLILNHLNSQEEIKQQFIKSYNSIYQIPNASFNVITKNSDNSSEIKMKKVIKKIVGKIKKTQLVKYNVKQIVGIGFKIGIQNWMSSNGNN